MHFVSSYHYAIGVPHYKHFDRKATISISSQRKSGGGGYFEIPPQRKNFEIFFFEKPAKTQKFRLI